MTAWQSGNRIWDSHLHPRMHLFLRPFPPSRPVCRVLCRYSSKVSAFCKFAWKLCSTKHLWLSAVSWCSRSSVWIFQPYQISSTPMFCTALGPSLTNAWCVWHPQLRLCQRSIKPLIQTCSERKSWSVRLGSFWSAGVVCGLFRLCSIMTVSILATIAQTKRETLLYNARKTQPNSMASPCCPFSRSSQSMLGTQSKGR